jgi:hypothetical protein
MDSDVLTIPENWEIPPGYQFRKRFERSEAIEMPRGKLRDIRRTRQKHPKASSPNVFIRGPIRFSRDSRLKHAAITEFGLSIKKPGRFSPTSKAPVVRATPFSRTMNSAYALDKDLIMNSC